jgi:hypothetical protein
MIIEVADGGQIPAIQKLVESAHDVRKLIFQADILSPSQEMNAALMPPL